LAEDSENPDDYTASIPWDEDEDENISDYDIASAAEEKD
jgi:hypothetical protein